MSKNKSNSSPVQFSVVNLPENLTRRSRVSKYQPVVEKLQAMKIGDGKSVSMPVPKNQDADAFRANLVQNINRYVRVGTRMSRDEKNGCTVFLFPSAGRQNTAKKSPKAAKKS